MPGHSSSTAPADHPLLNYAAWLGRWRHHPEKNERRKGGGQSTPLSGTSLLMPVRSIHTALTLSRSLLSVLQRWPGPDNSTSQNLTVDGQQGATSVTVANASGFAAGQFVLLDETSGASWQPVPATLVAATISPTPCPPQVWQGDVLAWNMHYRGSNSVRMTTETPIRQVRMIRPRACFLMRWAWFSRTDRPTNEIKEIASVSGNTITFTRRSRSAIAQVTFGAAYALYQLTAALTGNSIHVTNAGVENLSMYGGADGELGLTRAAYSWAKNVEVTQWIGDGVDIDNSFRVEVRDSYIHTGSWPEPGGAGYIASLADGFIGSIDRKQHPDRCVTRRWSFRSSGAGSVVGLQLCG